MDIETTRRRLFAKLDKMNEGMPMIRHIPVRQFSAGEMDLNAIRKVAGNPDLSADEVFDFPKFVIARSGRNHNRTEVAAEGQTAAVAAWIGRPVYFEDHKTEARNQIGRIYAAWTTTDNGGETVTYGRAYGIKTETDKDLQSKIRNRIHSEMSCAYEVLKSVCSVCGADVLKGDCLEHGANPEYFARDMEFKPDHVSFVGRPGIEGAGLVTNAKRDDTDQTERLHRLAKDGEYFREYVSGEFVKWFRMNNPTSTADELSALTDKLSAKEMMTFARIEKERAVESLPDGRQQTEAPQEDEAQAISDRPFKTIKDIYRS